mgnify:CR=1 FL=1
MILRLKLFIWIFALLCVNVTAVIAAGATEHPMDGLEANEIELAITLLKRDGLPGAVLAATEVEGGRHPDRWVEVSVEEAYIHCSKHVPRLAKVDKEIHWGSDDESCKGGDFFSASTT